MSNTETSKFKFIPEGEESQGIRTKHGKIFLTKGSANGEEAYLLQTENLNCEYTLLLSKDGAWALKILLDGLLK